MRRRRWHIQDLGNGRFRVYLRPCSLWSWTCEHYDEHHHAMLKACAKARAYRPRRQSDYKLAGGDHT